MTFRKLTLEELKKDYIGRHGFLFKGNAPCNKDNCLKVSNAIIQKGICAEMPEFVVEFDAQTFFFIYPNDCRFDCPTFIQTCQHLSVITNGCFQIESLSYFLQNYSF
jgi:hypothetical protein